MLKENYKKAVDAYIKEFEKNYEVTLDYWIGDDVAMFGDESYDFKEIKYMIDNSIKYEYLYNWFYFIVEFGKKCFFNFDSYCRLRRDAEKNEYFKLENFEKQLIYMRVSDKR